MEARCLEILDELEATGESIVISKGGRPIARLEPMQSTRAIARAAVPQHSLRGSVRILADIVGPTTSPDDQSHTVRQDR
jgi:antitoxin (DNA-binding transcriptional repressor) of toxin-antitoxin stability system